MGAARIRGTLAYFKCSTWGNILKRCTNTGKMTKNNKSYIKKNIQLKMSKDEYYNFCEKNKKIILDMYQKGLTPSIDRIDAYKNYEVANLQILALDKNRNQARTEENIRYAVKKAAEAKEKKVYVKTEELEVVFFSIKDFYKHFKFSDTHGLRIFKNKKLAKRHGLLILKKGIK